MRMATFNYIEAMLWFVIAVSMFGIAWFDSGYSAYKRVMILASLFFFAFGISDVIEASTGAWWKPAGLLILKVSCIIGFVYCFISYLKIKRDN